MFFFLSLADNIARFSGAFFKIFLSFFFPFHSSPPWKAELISIFHNESHLRRWNVESGGEEVYSYNVEYINLASEVTENLRHLYTRRCRTKRWKTTNKRTAYIGNAYQIDVYTRRARGCIPVIRILINLNRGDICQWEESEKEINLSAISIRAV